MASRRTCLRCNESLPAQTAQRAPRGCFPVRAVSSVADLQGFWRDGRFVLKTFAILDLVSSDERRVVDVICFRAPCDAKELSPKNRMTNAWLEQHHHRYRWTGGDVEYEERFETLRRRLEHVTVVYVKGGQKKAWLTPYAPPSVCVVDLETLGCPRIAECVARLQIRCSSLKPWLEDRATMQTIALYYWLSQNRPSLLYGDGVKEEAAEETAAESPDDDLGRTCSGDLGDEMKTRVRVLRQALSSIEEADENRAPEYEPADVLPSDEYA